MLTVWLKVDIFIRYIEWKSCRSHDKWPLWPDRQVPINCLLYSIIFGPTSMQLIRNYYDVFLLRLSIELFTCGWNRNRKICRFFFLDVHRERETEIERGWKFMQQRGEFGDQIDRVNSDDDADAFLPWIKTSNSTSTLMENFSQFHLKRTLSTTILKHPYTDEDDWCENLFQVRMATLHVDNNLRKNIPSYSTSTSHRLKCNIKRKRRDDFLPQTVKVGKFISAE